MDQIQNNRVRKILKDEITWAVTIIISVITLVKMVIIPIYGIQKDIENIKSNHLSHIQNSITKIEKDNEKNLEDHGEIFKLLERHSTILNQ